MSNQFFNSIVRGAGLTIGRNAVNSVSRSRMSFGKIILNLFLGAMIGVGLLIGLAYLGKNTDAYKQSQAELNLHRLKKDSIENAKLGNVEYYKGHVVYTGKRGGKYYYSKSGKKVYIK